MPGSLQQRIAAVRRFGRFYTRQIGVLRKTYLDTPYSLGEMRVIYELAHGAADGDGPTASDIARALDLDAGYLSRVLRNFEKRGLIARKTSKQDARQSHLSLTAKGRKMFAPAEERSNKDVAEMLGRLSSEQQTRLVSAMETIETLLGGESGGARVRNIVLREPRHGDFGWIVSAHGRLYAQEYGWTDFEGLVAQIVADFIRNYDPKRERCWIAEMEGENVGCVMVVKDTDQVARIRLLLIDPKARGQGLGTKLVGECIAFARAAGYSKMTLWTHSVLEAARVIYDKAGFTLTASESKRSFGKDVVSEFWDMQL